MEASGYTPNVFARGLGLDTMKTIGILCADSSDLYLAKAVYYLEKFLRLNSYDTILCCTLIFIEKSPLCFIVYGTRIARSAISYHYFFCLSSKKSLKSEENRMFCALTFDDSHTKMEVNSIKAKENNAMKQTIISRLLLLLLTLALTLGVTSCVTEKDDPQGTDAKDDEQTQNTAEIDPTETLPQVTFGGDIFTILLRNGEEHIADLAVSKLDENSTSVDKAVYSRNNNVEEHFNIEFSYVMVAVSNFANTVTKAISSDPELYDVIAGEGRTIFKGVTSGYYKDWNELEYIDLSGDWWSQSARRDWTTRWQGLCHER